MLTKRLTADRAKTIAVLFFSLLLVLGICTGPDYGMPWDEPWEQDILRMNLNEYAARLGSDVRLDLLSDIEVPEDGRISQSIEKDHGESAYYPVAFLVMDNNLSAGARMRLWHLYTWLWLMTGAVALYQLAGRLRLSPTWRCVAVLLLVLSPRLFAQGHYNNKDMVLLSLLLLLLWLMMRLWERPTVRRAVPFALLGAVAANTKIIGLFLFGLCALLVLVRLIMQKRMNRSAWAAAIATLVLFFGFWVLLTPAMWQDIPGYLAYTVANARSFSRWSGYVLFRDMVYGYQHATAPFYYLPYMIVVTTPLWLLVMIAAGQVYAMEYMIRHRKEGFRDATAALLFLCTVLWLTPMLVVLVLRPNMYNGWRHYYFLMAPMLVLAAYGLGRAWNALRALHKPVFARVFAALLALVMGLTGIGMIRSHPHQYTYYNPLLTGKPIPDTMELDYWNVSVLETLQTLLAQTEGDITVAGADGWAQTGLDYACVVLPEEQRNRLTVLPEASPGAMFYLVNPTYIHFSGWRPGDDMAAAVQTMSYGWPICVIYAADTLLRGAEHE